MSSFFAVWSASFPAKKNDYEATVRWVQKPFSTTTAATRNRAQRTKHIPVSCSTKALVAMNSDFMSSLSRDAFATFLFNASIVSSRDCSSISSSKMSFSQLKQTNYDGQTKQWRGYTIASAAPAQI
jgi:hypothetical protein